MAKHSDESGSWADGGLIDGREHGFTVLHRTELRIEIQSLTLQKSIK